MGATGESATATPTASSDPSATAQSVPSSPSAVTMAGLAPRARSTGRSLAPARIWRATACVPTSSAARAAMMANAARAIQSGSIALCTWAASADVTLNHACPPFPRCPSIERSAAGTLAAPPASWSPYQLMPLLVPAASSVRAIAGVRSSSPWGRSMSSCTSPLLNSTRPVMVASIRTAGRCRGVPYAGEDACASV